MKLLVQAGADVHIRADKVRTGVAECWCMNLMVILIWSCDHYSWHYTTDYDWDMPLVWSSNKTPHVEVLFLLSLMLSFSVMLCGYCCFCGKLARIADICHDLHNRRRCTFFQVGVHFYKESGKFWCPFTNSVIVYQN